MNYRVVFGHGPGERFASVEVPPFADPWARAEWVADEMYRRTRTWQPKIYQRAVAVDVDTGRGVVLSGGRPVRMFRIKQAHGEQLS